MLDNDQPETTAQTSEQSPEPSTGETDATTAPAKKTAAKKSAAKKTATKTAAKTAAKTGADKPAKKTATKKSAAKKSTAAPATEAGDLGAGADESAAAVAPAPLFQTPETVVQPARKRTAKKTTAKKAVAETGETPDAPAASADETAASAEAPTEGEESPGDGDATDGAGKRRARRRGGRRRRKSGDADDSTEGTAEDGADSGDDESDDSSDEGDDGEGSGSSRRRRRRRRSGGGNGGGDAKDAAKNGASAKARNPEDEITALSGSTRLEAKRQRRREGREAGRRRAPIVSEAEFLARRESVERVMAIRQRDELTQIGVLEDKVLVEHYVARESQTSLIGNVYLGRVQNVLPSMEAAFIDIGKGRNAVLYAGEVNWTALGAKDGQPRKIESVLSSGQTVLVQVTKDPIGHKGARLTSQVSLPGRFLVYVPDGTTSGISRKLPENERNRLKTLLKEIVPDTAGVIVRTAAEGASEEELTRDVERLTARWADIEAKVKSGGGKEGAPQLLYGEPDLTLKVVRDLFTEDFTKLIVQGDDAWDLVDNYVSHVAPDLRERLERYQADEHDGADLFAAYRLDEQIAKGLDRKVWLPSGGSLIIDRTEAMTVVDVNTGKFTGSGGNLEETVTKNNLEAAEEIVRQLRLRDIGGIVVIDFIDMVLESNRDLVLRRLVECLGRDRTRHQVAEVTSLGLVQMTRKRIGTGLLEAFSEECTHCKGRGLTIHDHPIEPSAKQDDAGERRGGRRSRGGRGRTGASTGNGNTNGNGSGNAQHAPSPAAFAAMANAAHHHDEDVESEIEADLVIDGDDVVEIVEAVEVVATPEAEPAADLATESEPTAEPEPEPTAEPEPAAGPVVVTTTRRRAARRVAGPPADADVAAQAPDSADDAADNASEAEDGDPVLHVPVKRKGSRKR